VEESLSDVTELQVRLQTLEQAKIEQGMENAKRADQYGRLNGQLHSLEVEAGKSASSTRELHQRNAALQQEGAQAAEQRAELRGELARMREEARATQVSDSHTAGCTRHAGGRRTAHTCALVRWCLYVGVVCFCLYVCATVLSFAVL
jgi:chromosome segregation ATPase